MHRISKNRETSTRIVFANSELEKFENLARIPFEWMLKPPTCNFHSAFPSIFGAPRKTPGPRVSPERMARSSRSSASSVQSVMPRTSDFRAR